MMWWEVDPDLVRPGWSPLVVVVLLGIVLFFLGRSLIRQFGKIDVPADHDPSETAGTPGTGTAGTPGTAEGAGGASGPTDRS